MVTTHNTRECSWCGEEILGEQVDEHVSVINGDPHRDANVIAYFHNGELPCFSEASDCGW